MSQIPLSEELLSHIVDRLKAMADPTRLRILHLLGEGSCCVSDLVAGLGCTQANISKHLATLRNAGLVRSRREGMHVVYSLEEPSVFEICNLVCGCLERQVSEIVAELGKSAAAEAPRSAGEPSAS